MWCIPRKSISQTASFSTLSGAERHPQSWETAWEFSGVGYVSRQTTKLLAEFLWRAPIDPPPRGLAWRSRHIHTSIVHSPVTRAFTGKMERAVRVRGRDFPSSSLCAVSATQRASASSTSHNGGREVIKIEIPAAWSKPRSTYRRRHLRLIATHFFVLIVLCVIIGRACAFAPLHTRRIALPTSPFASRPPPNFRIFLFGFGGKDSQTNKNSGNSSLKPRPFAPERMVKYNDDIFAKIWIFLFTGKIAAVVGAPSPRNFIPYEEYVRLSRLLLRGGSTKAKSAVLSVLRSIAFPGFSSLFRTLFPGSSRLACEFNARVTPIFFSWLVGPAKVETSEMLNPVTYVIEHVEWW